MTLYASGEMLSIDLFIGDDSSLTLYDSPPEDRLKIIEKTRQIPINLYFKGNARHRLIQVLIGMGKEPDTVDF
jgi:hypothetical protein